MIIVSNTSPISNLAQVGRLEILQQIYGKIIIPTAVYNELTAEGAGDIVAIPVKTYSWIETRAVTDFKMVNNLLNKLDEGEAEAITLAIELAANQLLIDERVGRREANRLKVPITGVLGVLLLAKQRGIIPAVKPAIDDLISQAVFRISDRLYASILYDAGEEQILP